MYTSSLGIFLNLQCYTMYLYLKAATESSGSFGGECTRCMLSFETCNFSFSKELKKKCWHLFFQGWWACCSNVHSIRFEANWRKVSFALIDTVLLAGLAKLFTITEYTLYFKWFCFVLFSYLRSTALYKSVCHLLQVNDFVVWLVFKFQKLKKATLIYIERRYFFKHRIIIF